LFICLQDNCFKSIFLKRFYYTHCGKSVIITVSLTKVNLLQHGNYQNNCITTHFAKILEGCFYFKNML